MTRPRVRWYVGISGAGKTQLALGHFIELVRARRVPGLVIDSAGVDNFAALPTACSADHALRSVYGRRRTCRLIPRDAGDVDQVARAVCDRGGAVLLVDETAEWISARSGTGGELLRLMRLHRHARADVLLTTQHFTGDVPQAAISCGPIVYVFRSEAPAVLDRLEREWGIDRQEAANLPPCRCLVVESGFSS